MVRLLHCPEGCQASLGRKFQSHNGAIAANDFVIKFVIQKYFQSHNGAIAAHHLDFKVPKISHFQSHNGAIAARRNSTEELTKHKSFNPTMVRLLLAMFA